MRRTLVALSLLASLLAGPAVAHDVWVDADYTILFGHPDDGPGEYSAERVREVTALDAAGEPVPTSTKHVDGMTRVSPEQTPAVMLVMIDNGYYTQDASGDWHRGRAEAVADAEVTNRYLKYGKTVFQWSSAAAEPQGLRLEVVPDADPAELGEDERLPVRVYHEGEPLAEVEITRALGGSEANATTDAEGRARIAYDTERPQLYTVRHEVPSDEAGVGTEHLAGALYLHPAR